MIRTVSAIGLVAIALTIARVPMIADDVPVLLPLGAAITSGWIGGEFIGAFAALLATLGIIVEHPAVGWTHVHGFVLGVIFASTAVALSTMVARYRSSMSSRAQIESRHRVITENTPDAILIHKDGTITYANSAAATLFGAEGPFDLVGRRILDLVPPDRRDEVQARLKRTASGRRPPTHEDRSMTLDGREIWVAVRAAPLPDDGSIVVTFRDVGWRRDAEAQMRHSAEMMRALIDYSPVAILALNPDRVVTTWNPAAERTFGWTADEIVGRPYPLAGADDERSFADSFSAALEGRSTTFQARRKRKDGQDVDVIVSTAPVLDRNGALERVIALLVDTTEQRRLEEEFRQAQKMEAIGRLAGGVAHDFNNLLTAILGFAEIALEDMPASSPGHAELKEIVRAGERATSLTRQLLAFSRKQIMQPCVIDVNEHVRNDERFLKRIIGEDVRIVLDLAPEPAFVLADPAQLDQVIMNLAVNARDAMPSGGVLEIEVRPVTMDSGHRRHGVEMTPGEYVRIAITDTGQGMTREVQERLFEPFFTTKAQGKGTGLGLATVFGIVKQSGGYIWVYSEQGAGTAVKVYLPVVEARPSSGPADVPAANVRRGAAGEYTVLVVDDEAAVSELTRRVLAREGYNVLVASGPFEATRLARNHAGTIDLLVTDVVMPEASGSALADSLRESRPGVRVLYMSGYAAGDVIHRAVSDPSARFIEKPFAAEALLQAVRQVLGPGTTPEG